MSSGTPLVNAVLVAVTGLPGALFWRAQSGLAVTQSRMVVRMNVPGTPDILGAYRGRPVGLEAKMGSGRQSSTQRGFQAAWQNAGGLYFVVRSVDDALAALAGIRALDA